MLAGFDDKTGANHRNSFMPSTLVTFSSSGYAMCVFSYTSGPGAPVQTFVGKTDGKIVPPRGESGFGFLICSSPNYSHVPRLGCHFRTS